MCCQGWISIKEVVLHTMLLHTLSHFSKWLFHRRCRLATAAAMHPMLAMPRV